MKRDEIDTDPSSPQSRRGSTDPGIGPRPRTPTPGPAIAAPPPGVGPGSGDSIDEILEGITSRPRAEPAVAPRTTAQTSGDAAAAYQANARAPNAATTNPGQKPAVMLSPSVEQAALGEKVPSSLPRPVVRDTRPDRPPSPRSSAPGFPAVNTASRGLDVDTVLTPAARFKRFLRRAVMTSVVLALLFLVLASWKRGRAPNGTLPVTGAVTGAPAAAAPPPPAETAIPSIATNAPAPAESAVAAPTVTAAPSASAAPPVAARIPPRSGSGGAASPATKNGAVPDPRITTPKAPPPPAPGYEEFKKSFTP